MKIRKNRTIIITILLMLSMSTSMLLLPATNAHTPPWQIPTTMQLGVSPNPIGIGQTAQVIFWLDKFPPTAYYPNGDRWSFTVTVTDPNGNKETMGPFTSDDVGAAHTTYVPSQTGNYTFVAQFPGQTIVGANPAFWGVINPQYINDTYLPSDSNPVTLAVQEQPISYLPSAPLPTSYWNSPIYATNTDWAKISGNWLGFGLWYGGGSAFKSYNATTNFNPYTTAPNTAHIMWTNPVAFGGQIGGESGTGDTVYSGASVYTGKFQPIIIQGILYYTQYPTSENIPTGFSAVDLKTGQTIYTHNINATQNNFEALRCGQVLNFKTPNEYGGYAYLWSITASSTTFTGLPISATKYSMYDAMTGNWILDIVNTVPMTLTEDQSGNLIGYYTNSTDNTLTMWNSTKAIQDYSIAQGGDKWSWLPPQGASIPWSTGIEWSVPVVADISGIPITPPLTAYGSGLGTQGTYRISGDTIVLTSVFGGMHHAAGEPGWTIDAGYSATTGQLLWGPVNRTDAEWDYLYDGQMGPAANGVYAEYNFEAKTWTGYSLTTGEKVWESDPVPNNAWSQFGSVATTGYGSFYVWDFGGNVYSINMTTGKLIWSWSTGSSGLETPWGIWSFWINYPLGTVADGKLYVEAGHSGASPMYKGNQMYCFNATTGKLLWSTLGFDVTCAPTIADGTLVTLNSYDNQIYAYGQGPTKTTVNAPQIGVTTATPITITGTIADISAGASQEAVATNFPSGLPCVSDESMSHFMEAVYEQQPMPNNVTGVPITISVLDSNNNYRTIGTTTSNTLGTYGFTWTPDIAGNYTIYASFAGSNSYYPSSAATTIYASNPPTTSSTATTQSNLATTGDLMTYILASAIAIIIVIAIVGVLIVMMMRKRA